MEMIDVLSKGTIDLTLPSFNSNDELFLHLTSMLKQSGYLNDEEAFIAALYEREEIGSTYMGEGVVIPHGKSETVNHAATAICRCSPLLKLETITVIGHLAGNSSETTSNSPHLLVREMIDVINGTSKRGVVNPEVFNRRI